MDKCREILLPHKAAVRRKFEFPDRCARMQSRHTDEQLFRKCGDNGAQGLLRRLRTEEDQGVPSADVADARRSGHLVPTRLFNIHPCFGIESILAEHAPQYWQKYVVKDALNEI